MISGGLCPIGQRLAMTTRSPPRDLLYYIPMPFSVTKIERRILAVMTLLIILGLIGMAVL